MKKTNWSHRVFRSKDRQRIHAMFVRLDRTTYRPLNTAPRWGRRTRTLRRMRYVGAPVSHLVFPERRRRQQSAFILAGVHLATARRARRGAL